MSHTPSADKGASALRPETFLLRRHSKDGEHPECADTEREEHDRHSCQGGPDTAARVLPHHGSVAGDSDDEDKDGQEQDRVERL